MFFIGIWILLGYHDDLIRDKLDNYIIGFLSKGVLMKKPNYFYLLGVICLGLGVMSNSALLAVLPSDSFGKTELHHAAQFGLLSEIQTLSGEGLDQADTLNKWTPLMVAARDHKLSSVKLLLELGANLYLEDREGKNALQLATNREVRAILEEGMRKHAVATLAFCLEDKTEKDETDPRLLDHICQRVLRHITPAA